MKRPEWAAAGTFPEAWREAAWTAASSGVPWHRNFGEFACKGLSLAHVITMEREQVDALPDAYDTYAGHAAAFRDVRLPFNPLYISLDRAALSRYDPPGQLLGALVGIPEGSGVAALKTWGWDGRQPLIVPVFASPERPGEYRTQIDGFVYADPVLDAWRSTGVIDNMGVDPAAVVAEWGGTEKDLEDGRSLASDAACIVAKALYFLESANVELVEGNPIRQERRAVERKGGRVALTVQIRQPKKRPRSDGPALHPEWSHRWEVRGHYKHFPVGTKLADSRPDKLVAHPTLGQCRRIWCPPFVKGPQDKPLVPKLRVVT